MLSKKAIKAICIVLAVLMALSAVTVALYVLAAGGI